jgi:hypothetical protein
MTKYGTPEVLYVDSKSRLTPWPLSMKVQVRSGDSRPPEVR